MHAGMTVLRIAAECNSIISWKKIINMLLICYCLVYCYLILFDNFVEKIKLFHQFIFQNNISELLLR